MHFFIFCGPIRVYYQVSNYDPLFYIVYMFYSGSKYQMGRFRPIEVPRPG